MAERVTSSSITHVEGFEFAGQNRELLDQRYPEFKGFSERDIVDFAKEEGAPKRDSAMSWLFDCYYPFAKAVAVSRCGDYSWHEEVVQDSFLSFFHNIKAFTWEDDSSVQKYLAQTVKNKAVDAERKNVGRYGNRPEEISLDGVAIRNEPVDKSQLPENIVIRRETSRAVILEIAKLPMSQRAVIILRFGSDLSVVETASQLQTTRNNIQVLQHVGIAKLRQGLNENAAGNRKKPKWLELLAALANAQEAIPTAELKKLLGRSNPAHLLPLVRKHANVTIENIYGRGYYLDDEQKAVVKKKFNI